MKDKLEELYLKIVTKLPFIEKQENRDSWKRKGSKKIKKSKHEEKEK